MRLLSQILSVVFVILIALLAMVFLSSNEESHVLKFLDWQLASAPVGAWILAGLAIGMALGWLLRMPQIFGLRRQNQKMRKKLTQQSQISSF